MSRSGGQQSVGDMRGRVTISDVSNALGLTKSTVSRALNDYQDIAEGTRLRVRRMAEKMGYRPLSHAQAIRTGRTKSLGLVIQVSDHDAQRPFLAEFLAGVSSGASAEGYMLTVASADGDAETIATYRTMLNDRKADGFILPRTRINDPRINLLRDERVPFVMFGRSPDPTGCAWFDVSGEAAMRDAVHRLAALGHKRIGYVGGGAQYSYAPLRQEGYLSAIREVGLPDDPALLRGDAVTQADGEEAARVLLSQPSPPTAIVCAVDLVAMGVCRAATAMGLRIGQDLSVTGYDGIPDGAHLQPPLTTYGVDVTTCGKRLSHLLIRRVRGEPPEAIRELVEAEFIDRGSIGPTGLTSEELATRIASR